jgi:UDP:flavonoid glycosyltransferase YjiC (YdhE family)
MRVSPIRCRSASSGSSSRPGRSSTSPTPFAGIPLQPEQHLNVHLAQRAGAAQLVTQDEVGSPRLIEAIGALLGSARHREAARRVQAAMAEVDGPGAAADAILELVAA